MVIGALSQWGIGETEPYDFLIAGTVNKIKLQ